MSRLLLPFCFWLCTCLVSAQHRVAWQVSGDDGPLIGATVLVGTGEVLITDQTGSVAGNFAPGVLGYRVSFVGFGEVSGVVEVTGDTTLRVVLTPSDLVMEEVKVSANSLKEQIEEMGTGLVSFSMTGAGELPYLLGEQDPMKFIQTQSGVASGTDGNNGYYVRGGGIDQNAIELDHMELYNTNHLFGFFSTFNPNAVDRVDFLKSGFPAQIGGRLSSMMSIRTIDPSLDRVHGSVKVGVLAAGLNLEVPVIRNRSSLLVAARKSYIDVITQNAFDQDGEVSRRTDYRFSDLIVKYYHRVNSKNTISLLGFMGTDDYAYRSEGSFRSRVNWQTLNAGLEWKWIAGPNLDGEVYVNTGDYGQAYGADLSIYNIELDSYISSFRAGSNVFLTKGRHSLTFSGSYTWRNFRPNQLQISSTQEEYRLSDARWLPTAEMAVGVDDEINLTERVKMGFGLRVSAFAQLGPYTRYETTENALVVDSTVYQQGEVAKGYYSLEPRLRLNYLLDGQSALKASYDRNVQYIHLSPLGSVSLPTDIWVPSSEAIRPQRGHQWAVGYHRLWSDQLKYSVQGYYKLLLSQLEYRDGAIAGYSESKNFDDDFIFGKGRSAGIEFSLIKESEVLEYQVSYTLSKTDRKFESVEGGRPFPAKYDRTHDLNVVSTYHWGNWSFSGLFKLSSGSNITVPIAKYVINESVVSEYSNRNAFRLPMYHRLDVAANWHPRGNEQVTWVFSIYNVYNRRNPYFVYFDVQGDVSAYALDISLKEVSLFPVLPSLSFEYQF